MIDTLLGILLLSVIIGAIKYGGAAIEMLRVSSFKKKFTTEDGIKDFEQYQKDGFKDGQLKEIAKAAEAGVDYKIVADKNLYQVQMEQVRLGLEHGVNILDHCNSSYDYNQMKEIRLGLEAGIDVSSYCDPMLHYSDMEQKRLALTEALKSNNNS